MDSNSTNFLIWASNHTGDVPTWIMAILTPVSIFTGFWFARKQFKLNAKIEEQKFFLEIDKKFMTPSNLDVASQINDDLYKSIPFTIKDVKTEEDVSIYLNDLEYVCNLYDTKILSRKQVYILMQYQITDAFHCKEILDHVKKTRSMMGKNDVWDVFERVAKELDSTPEK